MTHYSRTFSLIISLMLPLSGAAFALAPAAASAQVIAPAPQSHACFGLTRNLSYGMGESSEVLGLQAFLFANGYFSVSTTGPFGPRTFAAVKRFQADHGVPSTGFVGPLTRAALSLLCTQPQGSVSVSSLSSTSGPVGTTVTVTGTGFTSDNTVHFGSGVIVHVAASPAIYNCPMLPVGTTSCGGSAQMLTFTVPNALDPFCASSVPRCLVASRLTTPGDYQISIENQNGTSNSLTFTVTDSATASDDPVVYSMTPTSGPTGTTVTIDGRNFSNSNVIHFGAGAITNIPIDSSIAISCTNDSSCIPGIHQRLTFTVPDSLSPYCASGFMCPMWMQKVTPGVYGVSVQSDGGTSNAMNFTVTSGSTNASPAITSISPSTASVGQTVTITGSGFSNAASLDIYQNGQPFGTLGNLTVQNDSTATFTVPEWIGVYCHHDAICIALAKSWPAGSYTVSVENAHGESNQVAFTLGGSTPVSGPISIQSLDAPTSIPMGVSGTWTVHASVPSTTGQLHYSVNWGDENPQAASIMAPQPTTIETNASFTHAYSHAGTFTPVFTVTDDAGHSATVSATVTITPWY